MFKKFLVIKHLSFHYNKISHKNCPLFPFRLKFKYIIYFSYKLYAIQISITPCYRNNITIFNLFITTYHNFEVSNYILILQALKRPSTFNISVYYIHIVHNWRVNNITCETHKKFCAQVSKFPVHSNPLQQ